MNDLFLSEFSKNIKLRLSDIRAAQKAYLIAKANEETIISISNDIQRKILLEGNYIVCDEIWNMKQHIKLENRRITDPNCTYLMDENIFVNDFLEKCYAEYCKAGIENKKGKEYIPEAEAKELRHKAENILLDLAIEILPKEMTVEKEQLNLAKKHWKYREQLLDLIMSV